MVNLQRLQAEARALKLSGRKALKKDVYALIQKQKSEDDYSSFKETLLRTDTKLLCQREVPHLLGCSNATSPGRLPIPQLLVLSSVLLLGGESGLPCCITLPRCPSIPSKIYAEIWLVQWQCWETGTLRDGLLSVGVGWQEWPVPPSLTVSFLSFTYLPFSSSTELKQQEEVPTRSKQLCTTRILNDPASRTERQNPLLSFMHYPFLAEEFHSHDTEGTKAILVVCSLGLCWL